MEITPIYMYLTQALAIITGCIMLSRIIRIFPTFVKTGDCGDSDHMLLGDGFSWKWFLTATHPLTIAFDTVMAFFAIFVFMVSSEVFPYIFAIAAGSYGIYKLALHMRKQHLKKKEFVDALKGD